MSIEILQQPKILEVPDAPVSVFGEIRAPGATRTIVLYAHFDGQPVDPRQWQGAPFTPVLRDKALYQGGREIPFPIEGQRTDRESRIYARSTSDDKGSIIAMLTALDGMRAANLTPSVNVKFFFEGEEEAGSAHLKAILEKYRDLLRADAWLFCDGPSTRWSTAGRLRAARGDRTRTHGLGQHCCTAAPTATGRRPGALIATSSLDARRRSGEGRGLPRRRAPDRAASGHTGRACTGRFLAPSLAQRANRSANAALAGRIMVPALNVRGIRVGGVRETVPT
jgi:hypothetical protein